MHFNKYKDRFWENFAVPVLIFALLSDTSVCIAAVSRGSVDKGQMFPSNAHEHSKGESLWNSPAHYPASLDTILT